MPPHFFIFLSEIIYGKAPFIHAEFLLFYDQYRELCMLNNIVTDTTKNKFTNTTKTSAANNNKIRLNFVCIFQNFFRNRTASHFNTNIRKISNFFIDFTNDLLGISFHIHLVCLIPSSYLFLRLDDVRKITIYFLKTEVDFIHQLRRNVS